MTDNLDNNNDEIITKELDNICEECKKEDVSKNISQWEHSPTLQSTSSFHTCDAA